MAQTTPDKPGNGGQNGKNAGRNNGNAKAAAQKQPAQKMAGQQNDANMAAMNDPVAMLKADHRKVEKLFEQFEKAQNSGDQSQLAEQICKELMIHTLLEEEIFYAECRDKMDDKPLDEAQVEHDGIKPLLMEIMEGSPEDEFFAAKVKVLSENVKHHVKEEEKPDGILAKAKQAGIATPDLAKEMMQRKQELMQEAESGRMRPPRPRTFRVATIQMRGMRQGMERSRHDDDYYNRPMPPRDDEGRFMSRGRSRYQYEHEGDDRRRMPSRDDEGRFRSRSRSDDDDDDDRRGHRGHGGWYGDSRAHAEAARRGWEERGERGETPPRSRYDDDDDDRRGHRGHGGWYGDPRGHSEAARRGWEHEDDESRGGRGWRGRR